MIVLDLFVCMFVFLRFFSTTGKFYFSSRESINCKGSMGQSLLTSLFTLLLINIRLNSLKPWPYM